jgi:hypothetical protein
MNGIIFEEQQSVMTYRTLQRHCLGSTEPTFTGAEDGLAAAYQATRNWKDDQGFLAGKFKLGLGGHESKENSCSGN